MVRVPVRDRVLVHCPDIVVAEGCLSCPAAPILQRLRWVVKMERSSAVQSIHKVSMNVDKAYHRQTGRLDTYGNDSYRHAGMNSLQRFV